MAFKEIPIEMILADYIISKLNTPFEWGKNDCVLFASGWVKEFTGKDHLEGLGTWSDKKSAHAEIKRAGGLEKALDDRFDRIHPNFAIDGDLALLDNCVCLFSGIYVIGPGKDGIKRNNRLLAAIAWRTK